MTQSDPDLPGGELPDGELPPGRGRLAESARVEAFSDGVLAIVITLLVLDLHAPVTRGHMIADLRHQWPGYVAYLASFIYVGVIWVNHHQLFTRIAAVDTGLLWRNLGLLLTTSVLPFPTAVLASAFQVGDRADQLGALILYALVAGVMAAAWLVIFHYLAVNPRLLADGVPPSFFVTERRRAWAGVAAYAVAALLALWEPAVALAVLAVMPLFYGLTSEGWHPGRRRARSAR